MLHRILVVTHLASVVLTLGPLVLVDARLLGLALTVRSIKSVADDLLPLVWRGALLAALSGTLLFAGDATHYLHDPAFLVKLSALLLAGVNLALFNQAAAIGMNGWGVDGVPVPARARVGAALSLLLWTTVLVAGRWIAFAGEVVPVAAR